MSASRVSGLGDRVTQVYRFVPAVAARLTLAERDALARDPDVESIELDLPRRTLSEAPQPGAVTQPTVYKGSIGEYTQGLHMVEAPWVWDPNGNGELDEQKPTGEGITVCVLDTGVDPTHPELAHIILGGKDFVDGDDKPWDQDAKGWGTGHGTHVAGIIAAQLGSGGANVSPGMDDHGVVGVAPGARLLIARVLDTQGSGVGQRHHRRPRVVPAAGGAASPRCRSGGPRARAWSARRSRPRPTRACSSSPRRATAAGPMDFPAAYSSVLAVGAVDQSMRRAPFSARGSNLSLMAPGVDVLSTVIQAQGTISQVELGDIPHTSRPLYLAPAGEHVGRLVDCGEADSLGSCREASCTASSRTWTATPAVPLQMQLANVMRQGARAVLLGDERARASWRSCPSASLGTGCRPPW